MSKKCPRCRKEGKARPHVYVSSPESSLIPVAFGKSPCYPSASGLCTGLLQMMHSCHSSAQFSPVAQSCLTLGEPMDCMQHTRLPVHHQLWSLFKLTSIESVMPSSHLILCRPLLTLPSILPSIKWPKYWSFSFSISASNEYSGMISFEID